MKLKMRDMLRGLGFLTLVACGPLEEQPTTSAELHAWRPSELAQGGPGTEPVEAAEDLPVKAMAPAPNLSSVETVAVCSAQFYSLYAPYECEVVSGLIGTYADHGGAWMQIITDELGYRSWGMATLNGSPLQEIYSAPIVDSFRNVIGYRRWWLANGYQGGTFYYRALSINSGGEKSDWLSVR
jgi:hypothetical protein